MAFWFFKKNKRYRSFVENQASLYPVSSAWRDCRNWFARATGAFHLWFLAFISLPIVECSFRYASSYFMFHIFLWFQNRSPLLSQYPTVFRHVIHFEREKVIAIRIIYEEKETKWCKEMPNEGRQAKAVVHKGSSSSWRGWIPHAILATTSISRQ